jgi:hypothetical protein
LREVFLIKTKALTTIASAPQAFRKNEAFPLKFPLLLSKLPSSLISVKFIELILRADFLENWDLNDPKHRDLVDGHCNDSSCH